MNIWVEVFSGSPLGKGMRPKHGFGHKQSCPTESSGEAGLRFPSSARAAGKVACQIFVSRDFNFFPFWLR